MGGGDGDPAADPNGVQHPEEGGGQRRARRLPHPQRVERDECDGHDALDPAIFPDPGRFDPARFEDPSAAIPPFSFVPFGGGARVCPGNEFARVETLVAVHYIVTRFRWKLAAGCDRSFSRFPLPYPSQGLLIDIEPIEK